MFKCSPARALWLAAAAVAAIATSHGSAQTAAPAPDPANAAAPVPPVKYVSPLAGYKAFADATMTPWRQANDTAAGIGWRAYARETQQPASAASAPHPHHRSKP